MAFITKDDKSTMLEDIPWDTAGERKGFWSEH